MPFQPPSPAPPPSIILEIHTHAHTPPLRPSADISFDLRRLPNPPKAIRDRYDGRSRRLREHLLREPAFVERLEGAVAEILRAVEEGRGSSVDVRDMRDDEDEVGKEDGDEDNDSDDDEDDNDDDEFEELSEEGNEHDSDDDDEEGVLKPSETEATVTKTDDLSTSTSTTTSKPGASFAGASSTNDIPTNGSTGTAGAIEESEQDQAHGLETFSRHLPQDPTASTLPPTTATTRILRISCFCARGRHRSVAFAEELTRWRRQADGSSWPVGWDVRIVHRDVDGGPRKREKGGGGGRRQGKGGGEGQGRRGRGDRWRRGMAEGDEFEG